MPNITWDNNILKLYVLYLKLKFNWVSFTLSGNPISVSFCCSSLSPQLLLFSIYTHSLCELILPWGFKTICWILSNLYHQCRPLHFTPNIIHYLISTSWMSSRHLDLAYAKPNSWSPCKESCSSCSLCHLLRFYPPSCSGPKPWGHCWLSPFSYAPNLLPQQILFAFIFKIYPQIDHISPPSC